MSTGYKFWMRIWNTIENTASYINIMECPTCIRFWDDDARRAGAPICVLLSWNTKRIAEEWEKERTYYNEIENPLPTGCGAFEAK